MSMGPLQLRDIGVQIGSEHILRDVSFTLQPMERLAILGASGCGKSTLLRVLSGLCSHQTGALIGLDDKKVRLVFQEPRLLPWKNVRDNILLGCQPIEDEDIGYLEELLSFAELDDVQAYMPAQLSGGMAQRVALLRALMVRPDILLLDEPFSSLDRLLRRRISQAYQNIYRRFPHSLILVTHQPEEAFELADRIIVLRGRPAAVVGNRLSTEFATLRELTDWLDDVMVSPKP